MRPPTVRRRLEQIVVVQAAGFQVAPGEPDSDRNVDSGRSMLASRSSAEASVAFGSAYIAAKVASAAEVVSTVCGDGRREDVGVKVDDHEAMIAGNC